MRVEARARLLGHDALPWLPVGGDDDYGDRDAVEALLATSAVAVTVTYEDFSVEYREVAS